MDHLTSEMTQQNQISSVKMNLLRLPRPLGKHRLFLLWFISTHTHTTEIFIKILLGEYSASYSYEPGHIL